MYRGFELAWSQVSYEISECDEHHSENDEFVHFLTVGFLTTFFFATGFFGVGFLTTVRFVVTTGFVATAIVGADDTNTPALSTTGTVVVVVVVGAGAGASSATGSLTGAGSSAGALSLTGAGASVVVVVGASVVVVGSTPSIVPSHEIRQSPFVTTGLSLASMSANTALRTSEISTPSRHRASVKFGRKPLPPEPCPIPTPTYSHTPNQSCACAIAMPSER